MSTTTAPAPTKAAAKPTITATMSQWAAGVTFEQLSPDAVYQAKRFLLDSIGCALGGYQQHDVTIALEVLNEIAGPGKATVIGSGQQMDAVSASLANALMIRCMDYNDIYWKQDPSHPSDIFPAAMACCERAGSDGRELIVGLVLGHEFEMRLCEAAFPGIRERGWHHATLTAFVSPIVAGRMLHLSAAADSACHRHQRQRARHAGRGHRRQADHDEEHRRPHGDAERRAGGPAGGKGIHRPRARDRRQGRAGALLRTGVEAEHPDRRAGRFMAYHTMWDEGVSHRSADPHADLGRARAGEGQRPEARTTLPRYTFAPPRAGPTSSAIPASTIRTPRRPPITRCPTSSPLPSPSARSRRLQFTQAKIMDPVIRAQLQQDRRWSPIRRSRRSFRRCSA